MAIFMMHFPYRVIKNLRILFRRDNICLTAAVRDFLSFNGGKATQKGAPLERWNFGVLAVKSLFLRESAFFLPSKRREVHSELCACRGPLKPFFATWPKLSPLVGPRQLLLGHGQWPRDTWPKEFQNFMGFVLMRLYLFIAPFQQVLPLIALADCFIVADSLHQGRLTIVTEACLHVACLMMHAASKTSLRCLKNQECSHWARCQRRGSQKPPYGHGGVVSQDSRCGVVGRISSKQPSKFDAMA